MAKETGGPAFPENLAVTPMGDTYSGEAGMTLRDYFAASVVRSFIDMSEVKTASHVAKLSYQIADAMIAERAK